VAGRALGGRDRLGESPAMSREGRSKDTLFQPRCGTLRPPVPSQVTVPGSRASPSVGSSAEHRDPHAFDRDLG
jgi:hypothetical protein